MRVLCFHPALAPYRVDFFNLLAERVELQIVLMLANLRTQGFDQKRLRGELTIPVSYARKFSICSRDIPWGCGSLVWRQRPDVVLVYECSPVTLLMIFLRGFIRLKFSLWTFFDDSPDLIQKRSGLRKVLRDWVMNQVDGVIVPSGLAMEAYLGCVKTQSELRFATVPIIHDVRKVRMTQTAIFDSAERWRRENLKADEIMALFVGRLTKVKNLEWLADRFEDSRWPRNIRLFVIGDGEQRVALEGRLPLLGRYEGDALNVFFAAADFLILPSSSETFGAVVSEGLQWGAPALLSSRVGAKSLIRDMRSGCVFEFGDSEDFHAKLKSLMERVPKWVKGRPSLETVTLSEAVEGLVEKMR